MRPVSYLRQALILAALLLSGGVLWHERELIPGFADAATSDGGARRNRAVAGIPVITAAVTRARDALVLEVVGTGRARRSVMLRSRGSGEIVAMPLETQRNFEAGAVLMELDAADERLALSLAQTRLTEAERTLERLRRLSDSGAATGVRLEEAETAAAIARLQLEQAREALADRTLRAPFAGVPGLPDVEAGAWVDEGDAIASYDDRRVLLVEFDLPETALARMRPGVAVTARTPSAPGRSFDGEVVALDSRIDADSRTARVRVALPNPDDVLRPGVSFVVRVALEGDVYPVVPELAVQFSRGDVYVWRIADGMAERVDLRMVRRRDGAVLVEGPLHEGDRVVVEGTQRLSPGRAVSVDGGEAGAAS